MWPISGIHDARPPLAPVAPTRSRRPASKALKRAFELGHPLALVGQFSVDPIEALAHIVEALGEGSDAVVQALELGHSFAELADLIPEVVALGVDAVPEVVALRAEFSDVGAQGPEGRSDRDEDGDGGADDGPGGGVHVVILPGLGLALGRDGWRPRSAGQVLGSELVTRALEGVAPRRWSVRSRPSLLVLGCGGGDQALRGRADETRAAPTVEDRDRRGTTWRTGRRAMRMPGLDRLPSSSTYRCARRAQ